jgi:phosphopantothenoylcysteine decarboxylase / phosphopantothenate---cysteine ligase
MASLTIRRLDDELKKRLRLQAARHGRSMEDEARVILRQAASRDHGRTSLATHEPPLLQRAVRETEQETGVAGALAAKRVLLIIGGGIAAYKSLDLIRRLRERGVHVRCVMSKAAQEFATPLSVGAIAGEPALTELFDTHAEFDIGHIRLAREPDLVVVAPATADLMAKMAGGHADDLASTVLLATDKPILIAPAMNPLMWENPAMQRNLAQLIADGVTMVGPNEGEMAESGEAGIGRMAEPLEIVAAVETFFGQTGAGGPLASRRVLVTAGPTHEPIDPVRYIANRSSGKQGYAIAAAAAAAGGDVTLISGPVNLPAPPGVRTVKVETAVEMLKAVEAALPADAAVFAAAVADWRLAQPGAQKIKKRGKEAPELALVENPDILATVARRSAKRPKLVIGFAAETEKVVAHAKEKLAHKGCDWIVANDVSPQSGVMGGDRNTVHLVTTQGVDSWPPQSKEEVAAELVARIAAALAGAPA